MSLSPEQLKQISNLAYLEINPDWIPQLTEELNSIVNLVTLLQDVDTTGIEPLMHPIDNNQRLRTDDALPCNTIENLAKIAPQFKDNLYLVPKVIK